LEKDVQRSPSKHRIADGTVTGGQFSGFMNVSDQASDVQAAGFMNIADKMKGLQLGFINICDTLESGVPIGFISVVKNGYQDFELSASETWNLQVAYGVGIGCRDKILT